MNHKKKLWLYCIFAVLTLLFGGPGVVENINNTQTQEPYVSQISYSFRNEKLLDDHYEKHGKEMGFEDAKSYEAAANEIIFHPDSLHRIEEEDGDDVYYLEKNNGFVIVSKDGYIRTFFYPEDGLAYFNRQ